MMQWSNAKKKPPVGKWVVIWFASKPFVAMLSQDGLFYYTVEASVKIAVGDIKNWMEIESPETVKR